MRGPGHWWNEIRRRHVLRVAAYYLVAAWGIAQVADLLLDAFDAGVYTRFVIGALVAGLPVALVLAWVFDVTPRGIERTLALVPGIRNDSDADVQVLPQSQDPAPGDSIAVLPFTNLGGEASDEYLSDGLAEEIRNQLARVAGLRVAARTSSFAFKDRHVDVRTIGRALNVAAVLEGGLRRHGAQVRIDVQLIDAQDGYLCWSQTFEHELGDVFRLQGEVSRAVITAVGARLGRALRSPIAPEGPRSFEAYSACLRGRFHFHKRTEAALLRAAELFERAVELDPGYALAYSGLADTWLLLSARHYGNVPVAEALARAQPAAETALRLEPGLAEAHASLGLVRLSRGDPQAAIESLERAVAFNPGYAMAHVWLGLALLAQGRYAEAAARNQVVYRLDPLSPIVVSNAGFDALRFGRDDEARERFTAAIELDAQFPVPLSGMSRLHATRGDVAGGLEWVQRAIAVAPNRAFYRARRGLLSLQLGDVGAAVRSIAEARQRAADNVFDAELLLALHMVQGDVQALEEIAAGQAGASFGGSQRAYALAALNRDQEALAIYDSLHADAPTEIDEVLLDDWVWRLPHTISRARLRLQWGDAERARAELLRFEAHAKSRFDAGIVSGDVRYWCATACLLLGQPEVALRHLETAVEGGWRHAWWARLDPNLQAFRATPGIVELLRRATPGQD